LWLLLAAARDGGAVAIAAFVAEGGAPRVAALLADRARLTDSDAETLRALAAAAPGPEDAGPGADVAAHARWLDVLGRESLTRRFYRALEREVRGLAATAEGRADEAARRELALLNASRLLFLSFLEAKGWLDGDRRFLARRFERCMDAGGGFHRRVLLPLFFGTLNTPWARRAPAARALGVVPFLNGGLFQRTPLERQHGALRFADEALGRLFAEVLGRYRFTAREDSAVWSEAAVDPEMLGRAFESLMSASERRSTGAFYTPPPLVERITGEALAHALGGAGTSPVAARVLLEGGEPAPGEVPALRTAVERLRVIDPACGSGALLVRALERLAAIRVLLGDARPVADVRRAVLSGSIFGVDVNPTAVWLCELRLWLSVSIDCEASDPRRVPPLPNLDHNVRVGDSLAGGRFEADIAPGRGVGRALAARRERYVRASGARKRTLGRALEREERIRAAALLDARIARLAADRRELAVAARARDLFGSRRGATAADRARLASLRAELRVLRARRRALAAGGPLPFAFATHFPEAAAAGGFDVVVANPPWVRPHHVDGALVAHPALRAAFRSWREAPWEAGADGAGAGRGFAGQVDLAALFVEQSLALARPGSVVSLLVPAKLWRSLAGGGVRRVVLDESSVLALEDLSDARDGFDAATYPSLLVARRRIRSGEAVPALPHALAAAVHRGRSVTRWTMPAHVLPFDESPGSPWLLLPEEVRSSFDRLRAAGAPLGAVLPARVTLGVKCGCNDAFVVRVPDDAGRPHAALARVRAGPREGLVERGLLRPLVRGETLAPWRARPTEPDHEMIVWTHGEDGAPLAELPPHAAAWLAPWRRRLARRADARGDAPWWTLFRVESARSDRARVVWADIGRSPRAAVLLPGDRTVVLNSCYVAPCASTEDALALAALLSGPVAAAWLDALAEPARGGYRRYLAWTMSLLPVPRDWRRARELLAPLGERASCGEPPTTIELTDAALEAYRLARRDVGPLLAWAGR
ncbi:MAG: Eco57I restriction-modification methylase domain-containing protein, partial [Gemmatimonadaceae bacterium]